MLVRHQVEFPKTHDLGKLLDLLAAVEAPLTERLGDVTRLDPYSVEARYPADLPAIGRAEAEEALTLIREVRDKVSANLAAYLQPTEPEEVEEKLPEDVAEPEPQQDSAVVSEASEELPSAAEGEPEAAD